MGGRRHSWTAGAGLGEKKKKFRVRNCCVQKGKGGGGARPVTDREKKKEEKIDQDERKKKGELLREKKG